MANKKTTGTTAAVEKPIIAGDKLPRGKRYIQFGYAISNHEVINLRNLGESIVPANGTVPVPKFGIPTPPPPRLHPSLHLLDIIDVPGTNAAVEIIIRFVPKLPS